MGCLSFPLSDESEPKRRRFFPRWNFGFGRAPPPDEPSSNSENNSHDNAGKLNDLTVFTLAELKAATRNFHDKIGEGGFGAVYKGLIRSKKPAKTEDRVEVAVKKLNVKGMQGQREWLSEITYLRMTDHPNLVKLLGYCLEDDERGPESLLVYEYMPNGSLDDHIFRKSGPVLPWRQRLQIAIGTAKALAYLHEQMKPQIIYRDLKAANILLDNGFNPKLSDFGMARLGPTMGDTHVTTAVVGTAGYAAPEYMQTGHLTAKSDVWSFGMVLLELLTGRRALDRNRPRTERSLMDWARPYMNDPKRFQKIIDPRLRLDYPATEARQVQALVQKCTARNQKTRPKMSEVARLLLEILTEGSTSLGRSVGRRSEARIDEESGSRSDMDSSREHSAYLSNVQESDSTMLSLHSSSSGTRNTSIVGVQGESAYSEVASSSLKTDTDATHVSHLKTDSEGNTVLKMDSEEKPVESSLFKTDSEATLTATTPDSEEKLGGSTPELGESTPLPKSEAADIAKNKEHPETQVETEAEASANGNTEEADHTPNQGRTWSSTAEEVDSKDSTTLHETPK